MKGVSLRRSVYWYRGRVDGQVVQFSLGTSDEAEAIRNARRMLAERVMAPPVPCPAWNAAVDGFRAYRERMGDSDTRRRFTTQILNAAGRDMDVAHPRDVTTARVSAWMARHTNQRTAFTYLDMLSRFFRWLIEQKKARENPCDGIKRPDKLPKAIRRRFLSREEAQRLLTTPCDDGLKFALYCSLHAGLRKGEVCAARPGWFDLRAGLLHITADKEWSTKSDEDRTIPLTPEFRAFLDGYGLRSPYMLRPEKQPGRHTHRVEFRKPFHAHLEACGISDCTFHDLRRTFASLLVSAGVSIYKVARWLGDGVAVVELHYGHLTPQDDDISRAWSAK